MENLTVIRRFIKQNVKSESEMIRGFNVHNTLRFLDRDEQIIIKSLIKERTKVSQSNLVQMVQFDKVKVSRLLQKLVEKEIVIKEEKGKTNYIRLHDDLKNIFLID